MRRSGLPVVIAAAIVAAMLPATPANAAIRGAGAPDAVDGSYIVVLNETAPGAAAVRARHGGRVTHVYSAALRGYAAEMTRAQAAAASRDPQVAYVAQNTRVHALEFQNDPPSWGLDRVDQRRPPYDQLYTYSTTASTVNAYILDTGIRVTHRDFAGRARHGRDAIDNDDDSTDCHGHGTHVAGTVGGTDYGVAKGVNLWAVRVLNCQGSGTVAQVVAGIDWVTANAVKPAVANMSLGGSLSAPLNQAVQRSVASGVSYAIAAGNSNRDACLESPGSTPEAITVGASSVSDLRAYFSNFGTCLDIFAPGLSIDSTWVSSDTATRNLSGTSMAAPHVAGAAALYLARNPTATPAQVRDALVNVATPGLVANPGAGSPNRMLFTDSGVTLPDPPPGCGPQTNDRDVRIPDAGMAVGTAIRVARCEGNASVRLEAEVHITHQYRGDLKVDLVAPSGRVFPLKPSSSTEPGSDLHRTFTVDASAETADGTWYLSVQDRSEGFAGVLDRWRLSVKA